MIRRFHGPFADEETRRTLLADVAEVVRSEGFITLNVHQPFTVPDPRCSRPLEDRLLETLATSRDATAKGTAAALGVPLRTVQGALKELVAEGACLAERKGRAVAYRVEDTTFASPTRTDIRLSPVKRERD